MVESRQRLNTSWQSRLQELEKISKIADEKREQGQRHVNRLALLLKKNVEQVKK